EANDLLIRGYYKKRPGHIISSKCEHASVTETIKNLNTEVTYVDIGEKGFPDPSDIVKAIRPNTTMIVFSMVNNETGIIYPIEELAKIALAKNLFFIVDGVAALGKLPITDFQGITAFSFSAHKCHGPKAIGFASF